MERILKTLLLFLPLCLFLLTGFIGVSCHAFFSPSPSSFLSSGSLLKSGAPFNLKKSPFSFFQQYRGGSTPSSSPSSPSSLLSPLSFSSSLSAFSSYHPLIQQTIQDLLPRFLEIDSHTMRIMSKLIIAFKEARLDSTDFHSVNGYGHGDIGREKYDLILAKLLATEAALVRIQFYSGTHAISTALFACLRPGDEFLSVSGHPYDTLEEVIGLRENSLTGKITGSLKDWGITYHQLPLIIEKEGEGEGEGERQKKTTVQFDLPKIKEFLDKNKKIKLIHIQRSCGYQWRPSIPIKEIERLTKFLKEEYQLKTNRDLIIFCDNCYGEFVEDKEPTHVGVDLIAGSLIKNLGGTRVPCGGYIAGRKDLVAAASNHLSAPGVEGGATLGQYKSLFQGLFNAPAVVGESIKGAEFLSTLLGKYLKYPCNPLPGGYRTDIVQGIQLGSRAKVIAFCEAVQRNSPVGAHILPIPGRTPGYGDEVIFAFGTFIEGSTLELSADAPLREPYVVYSQGCTHWTHWAIVLNDLLMNSPEFSKN